MNVLIAPDAFKDCLSASEVARAIQKGVLLYSEKAKCLFISASDGGEGFLNAVASYISEVKTITTQTVDPLGRELRAEYLLDETHKTAYVELARASGLELLSATERNPLHTSTLGTGIQIKDAIGKGATKIYLGIGGSATNDGGTGIAKALGFRFYNQAGTELEPKGSELQNIYRIEKPTNHHDHTDFFAVNDVLNPLFGSSGAACTYAKQKGANPDEIVSLDSGLENLHAVVQNEFQLNEAQTPGSGAAGGTAYGLKCFFNASYISGTSFILNLSNFANIVSEKKIDVIITGEGKIDRQTGYGKFVFGMVQEAKKYNIPVVAVCGKLELGPSEIKEIGLYNATEIYDVSRPVAYSYEHAANLISEKTKELLLNLKRDQATR